MSTEATILLNVSSHGVLSLPLQVCGPLADQDQKDLPGVQAEGGPVAGRLGLGLRLGREQPRGERGRVWEHAAAALAGLHQRPLLRHHEWFALAAGPRQRVLRLRGRGRGRHGHQRRQRGGHHRGGGGAAASAVATARQGRRGKGASASLRGHAQSHHATPTTHCTQFVHTTIQGYQQLYIKNVCGSVYLCDLYPLFIFVPPYLSKMQITKLTHFLHHGCYKRIKHSKGQEEMYRINKRGTGIKNTVFCIMGD